jgi:hypothetical protein
MATGKLKAHNTKVIFEMGERVFIPNDQVIKVGLMRVCSDRSIRIELILEGKLPEDPEELEATMRDIRMLASGGEKADDRP